MNEVNKPAVHILEYTNEAQATINAIEKSGKYEVQMKLNTNYDYEMRIVNVKDGQPIAEDVDLLDDDQVTKLLAEYEANIKNNWQVGG